MRLCLSLVYPLVFYIERILFCQLLYQTTQQTRDSSRHHKSSAADEDALVSEILGGASRQPSVASEWDEDLLSPKVGFKRTVNRDLECGEQEVYGEVTL